VPTLTPQVRAALDRGAVIPAMPLALSSSRRLDERRQRALIRYYADAGSGGLAVGVHTTQFAIRDPGHGLFAPVLELASEELDRADATRAEPLIRVAGICGDTTQALAEASLIRDLGYHAGLLSLAALRDSQEDALIAHCHTVADVLPVFGFYLQPGVGGRVLPYRFWRRLAEIDRVVAVKIAPFHRYRTLDVVRAIAESGRDDIALYTGNDDAIVADLVTPYRIETARGPVERTIVGGLLGQWAVWTSKAVALWEACHAAAGAGQVSTELLRTGVRLTDANAALFDVAHDFAGCIAGLHEVLRRQGLLAGTWCLDPDEGLSPGQSEEIDRVYRAYPELNDDAFVAANRDRWLSG
jgi:hypothetical protein